MSKAAHIVAGMAFGDEGKGATVDFLCRTLNAGLVVRYNGGPQASHTVVLPNGEYHMFSQFGAGTFAGADTHLSRFMLISPKAMMEEELMLRKFGIRDLWERLTVEDKCVVITPFHQAVNRILEYSRGANRHGSCGIGVGQARKNHLDYGEAVLFAGDLKDEQTAKAKLIFLQSVAYSDVFHLLERLPQSLQAKELLTDPAAINWCWDLYKDWPARIVYREDLPDLMDKTKVTVFEGAQGLLLDEQFGTAPHNTWTNTTFENAERYLLDGFPGAIHKIGCFRTYFTRHGAGPFPTEDVMAGFEELHNKTGVYQGEFRLGRFDWTNARYAVNIARPTELALSHLDRVEDRREFIDRLEGFVKVPVTIRGWGLTATERLYSERTTWRKEVWTSEKRDGIQLA